jgi:hypothetical protein
MTGPEPEEPTLKAAEGRGGWGRKALLLGLSVLLLVVAFQVADVDDVLSYLASFSVETLLAATGLLVANQVLGSLRFHLLCRAMGVRQSLWRAHSINTYSLVGGVLLFNFIGQSMTRSGLFKMDRNGGAAQGFAITALERTLSLVYLVVLLVVFVVRYTEGVSVHVGQVNAYVTLAVVVVLVVAVVFRWGLGRHRFNYLTRIMSGGAIGVFVMSSLLTLAMLLTMLAAYVLLARELLPGVPWGALPLPGAVSMLGASIPIGFAGWGLRELTASQAFTYIGMDPAAGVGMALSVGVLSLVALALNTLLVLPPRRRTFVGFAGPSGRAGMGWQYLRLMTWALPVLCVALLLFRIPLPTRNGFAHVNLADPFVVVAAGLFLVGAWRNLKRVWRDSRTWLALMAMVGGVTLSFILGWERHGLLDWAFYNRFLGVWVLLSLMLAGAFITNTLGRPGTILILRSYVLAVSTVLSVEFVTRAVEGAAVFSILPWNGHAFSGFSGGSTAYAHQIALALIFCLSGLPLFSGGRGLWITHGLAGLLVVGLWRTESLSALVAIAIVALVFASRRAFSLPRLAMAAAVVLVAVASLQGLAGTVINGGVPQDVSSPFHIEGLDWPSTDAWDDHAATMRRGALDLWRAYPLFGAGLGAFVADRLESERIVSLIPGSHAWILAEMGLLGLCTFLAPVVMGVMTMLRGFKGRKSGPSDRSFARLPVAGLAMVFVTMVMSVFHDLAYQRDFWLLLGAFLATPGALAHAFRGQHGPESNDKDA